MFELPQPLHILLITHNVETHLQLNKLLSSPSYHLVSCHSLYQALVILKEQEFHFILMSLYLSDSQGLHTLQEIKKSGSNCALILIEEVSNLNIVEEAISMGVQDYLPNVQQPSLHNALLISWQRHNLYKELQKISFTDSLTGLYNHRGFMALLDQHMALATRQKMGFYLFIIDFDGLKQINDQFGHLTGNQALIETAKCLNAFLRRHDIAARIGGDEFAILALATKDRGEFLEERIVEIIKSRNTFLKGAFQLKLSIGKSYYDPSLDLSKEELIRQADEDLYRSKRGLYS